MSYTSSKSQPIVLNASTEAQVYLLFALAMGLTLAGVFAGMVAAPMLLQSGMHMMLLIAELAIIFTAGLWAQKSPLNIILFGAFPFLSGITFTPYILMLLAGYVNGAAILLNALLSTVFMVLAAAVVARSVKQDLSALSGALLMGLIGLIVFGLLQVFIPALRTTGVELFVSAIAIVLFAVFTAVDLQRIRLLGRLGSNPFLLALSLYLDIYNLFLAILRFMTAFSGDRR